MQAVLLVTTPTKAKSLLGFFIGFDYALARRHWRAQGPLPRDPVEKGLKKAGLVRFPCKPNKILTI